MVNMLEMAERETIQQLVKTGWSYRKIAKELGINRETVAKYSKPANVRTGFLLKTDVSGEGVSEEKVLRKGSCALFEAIIAQKREEGLSKVRIFQDLEAEQGFKGSYSSVQRHVERTELAVPLPFRRIETLPGEQAQVDFGSGYWLKDNDPKRKVNVFRIVLSYSRKCYSEGVFRQDTETFLRCLENAFWFFGGVSKTLSLDNLKAAVIKADWYDPELNPKMASFAKHYGLAVLPIKPLSLIHI